MRALMVVALTGCAAACEAPKLEPRYEVESMPLGTTRQIAHRDVDECVDGATVAASTVAYRSTQGPVTGEKRPDKVAMMCLEARGYKFRKIPSGEVPRDPWTGERLQGWWGK